jgi:hypothetical protein
MIKKQARKWYDSLPAKTREPLRQAKRFDYPTGKYVPRFTNLQQIADESDEELSSFAYYQFIPRVVKTRTGKKKLTITNRIAFDKNTVRQIRGALKHAGVKPSKHANLRKLRLQLEQHVVGLRQQLRIIDRMIIDK